METPLTPTTEVATTETPAAHGGGGGFAPDVTMVVLTWVTFFGLLFILNKFGFKPILTAVQKREDEIRQALENADKLKIRLEEVAASRDKIIGEAHLKCNELIEQARKAGVELARVIQDKAHQESQILLENARQEIEASVQKARFTLRKESAEIAVTLASKILKERLDKENSERIVEELIKDI